MAGWAIGGAAVLAIGIVVIARLPRVERAAAKPQTTVTVATPAPMTTAPIVAPAAPAPAPAPPVAKPARAAFGIEVATFIFEDRADEERNRLIGMGQTARVVTTLENGSPSYRVVLGRYRSRGSAEHAADTLLSAGTVQEARVVQLGDDD